MIEYLTLILICQLSGEAMVSIAQLSVPGPVVGMLLLFTFLCIRGQIPETLNTVSNALLNNLSLMFIPAGVGVMVHFELLGAEAFPLSVAVIGSTIVTIAITALVMTRLQKRSGSPTKTEY